MATSGQEHFVYNTCMGSGCHEGCFLKTFVKDGKIVRTERAVLTEPEGDRFRICQKGISYAKVPYLPTRLLYPMKRVGPRGALSSFERISWDQAMAEIGAKLRAVRDTYGPRSVIISTSASGYPDNTTPCLHVAMNYGFIHAFDGTAWSGHAADLSCIGAQQIDFGSMVSYSAVDPKLLSYAKEIILWGGSPVGNTRAAGTTRWIMEAQEKGAKIIQIALTYSSSSAKADQFVPIKGGSDAALALAMANLLLTEDRYDSAYMRNHTVAPFLVRQDNGKFLRESDIASDGDPGKYVFWNTRTGEAQGVAPHVHDHGDALPDLEAVRTLNGIPCKTAFEMMKEHLAEWTLERQAELTGISPETVRTLVDEYMTNQPGVICLEEGLRYTNGVEAYRAIQLFAALSGRMGQPSSGLAIMNSGLNHPTAAGVLNSFPVMFPEGLEEAKGDYVKMASFFEEIAKPDPKFHAFLCFMGNPVHNNPAREIWEDFFPKMDLSVLFEVQMSDTALLADYVLPDTTTFERFELINQGNHIILAEPAIEPMGEVKTPAEFWHLLASEVGLGHVFDKTQEEWAEFRLQSQNPVVSTLEPPLTMERLKKEKMVRLNASSESYDPLAAGDFVTPSGQMEFYCEDMVEGGGAMAKWKLPYFQSNPDRKQYPLQLLEARHRVLMQSQLWYEVPDLMTVVGSKEPEVFINPADAAARGIKHGELVEVLNEKATIQVRTRFTQSVPPGTVQIWYSYREGSYKAGGVTRLGPVSGTPDTLDDFARRWDKVMMDRWAMPHGEKPDFRYVMAGRLPVTFNYEISASGNYDSLNENTCEVRKIKEA